MSKRKETWTNDNPQRRWRKYSYEDKLARDKLNFDITRLKDESSIDMNSLPEPNVLISEIIDGLETVLINSKKVKDSISYWVIVVLSNQRDLRLKTYLSTQSYNSRVFDKGLQTWKEEPFLTTKNNQV